MEAIVVVIPLPTALSSGALSQLCNPNEDEMGFREQDIKAARQHLMRGDVVLKGIIQEVGPFTLKTQRDYFQVLVRSIVSQQISTAAARTILQRLVDHLQPHKIAPETMAALDLAQLRALGVSTQKAGYVLDLTDRVSCGELNLKTIQRRSDEVVITQLTQVKGIGVWTAHMFMIFALGRLNVLPVGDLGVRAAIQRNYELEELPKPAEVETIAAPWRPYASIASWYLWRSLEVKS